MYVNSPLTKGSAMTAAASVTVLYRTPAREHKACHTLTRSSRGRVCVLLNSKVRVPLNRRPFPVFGVFFREVAAASGIYKNIGPPVKL